MTGSAVVASLTAMTAVTRDQTRRLAADLFNQVWTLMERDDRSALLVADLATLPA